MAQIISGKDVAAKIRGEISSLISECKDNIPCLATVRVGEKPDDIAYEQGVKKSMENCGMRINNVVLPETVSKEELEATIRELNEDPHTSGILLFRPLPKGLPETEICNMISVAKDVDCMNEISFAKLFLGEKGFYPCTAQAVMEILDYMKVDLTGKRVVIIGRSTVVGKPLGLMMLAKNATVTWCHSKTKDIPAVCENADIIVVAVGRAGFLKKEHVSKMADNGIVIDVGINPKPDGSRGICGDVCFEEVEPLVSYITPVPGGVGSVTSAVMAKHVAVSANIM